MRIGLLGGSFNPAHEGHVHVSEVALKRLGLDYVWWLVTPQNPLKSHGRPHAARRRACAMRKTVAHHPRIIVMDIERCTRHALLHRHADGVAEAVSAREVRLADGQRQSRDLPPLAALGGDRARGCPIAVIQRPGTVLACSHAKPMQRFGASAGCEGDLVTATPPAIAILDGRRNAQSATAIRAAALRRKPLSVPMPPC